MANTIPIQVRAVDPFAEYNSNATNRLTRMLSKGTNCILSNNPIDVIYDTTSPNSYVVVTSGGCIKDDLLINITSDFRVDLTDIDFYYEHVAPYNEAGYYYITLNYVYEKSKPIPQASIKIFKPSQRGSLTSEYLLLKVLNVSYTEGSFNIDQFLDFDPENQENKRICSDVFATFNPYLETFDPIKHIGKIVYDTSTNIPYIGTPDGWKEFGTFDYQCNTLSCAVGQLVYIGGGNVAIPAIATSARTCATAIVLTCGNPGTVRISGKVHGTYVQSGITLSAGNTLYLSSSEAGAVTNVMPTNSTCQIIGTCISTSGNDYYTVLASLSGLEGSLYHAALLGIQGGSSTEQYHLTAIQHSNIGTGNHETLAGLLGGDGTDHYHVGHSTFHNLGDGTHNQIAGTQGGTNLERYHLTLAVYNAINAFGGNHNNIPTGLQGGTSTQRYHLTQSQYNNLGDGSHNGLSGLQGGSSVERYHLTQSQYDNIATFPSGTRLVFYQSSPPAGWTQVTSVNDRVLRVVNSGGGGTGGSWVISGISVGSHYHTTGDCTLTIAQIPPHHHIVPNIVSNDAHANLTGSAYASYFADVTTTDTGGGQPHNHGATSWASGSSSSDGSWRPAYIDVIVAQKS